MWLTKVGVNKKKINKTSLVVSNTPWRGPFFVKTTLRCSTHTRYFSSDINNIRHSIFIPPSIFNNNYQNSPKKIIYNTMRTFCTEKTEENEEKKVEKQFFNIPLIEVEEMVKYFLRSQLKPPKRLILENKEASTLFFEDLGMGRFEKLKLVVTCEDSFLIEIPGSIFNKLTCVGDLTTFLSTQPYLKRNYEIPDEVAEAIKPPQSIYDVFKKSIQVKIDKGELPHPDQLPIESFSFENAKAQVTMNVMNENEDYGHSEEEEENKENKDNEK